MKLINILSEVYNVQKVDVLLKSNPAVSKTEIINKIRACPYIIVVRVIEDPRLLAKAKPNFEYSLLKIKFLNFYSKPSDTLLKIKNIIENGDENFHKINGIFEFRPLSQTIQSV